MKRKSLILGGFFDIPRQEEKIRELENKSSDQKFWDDPVGAQKVMKELNACKESVSTLNKITTSLSDLTTLLSLATEANDSSEINEVQNGISVLESEIKALEIRSLLNQPHDNSNAIITLHSGAGGTEACDWADMLLRMYMRWAERKNLKFSITDILPGDEAGIKRVTGIVSGPFAYGLLKAEMGVHRLVRISPFDSNARRHTSFASCDVIPEIDDEINISINEADLRVDTFRSSGAGGQHVNKTDSAVRLTHMPSGIVVSCQQERSQIKNRSTAMKVLKAKLYEREREKQRQAIEKHYDERGDIAWGNQIRSYVFMPYQLVKDMRSNFETGNVEGVINGDLDPFIKAFLDWKTTKSD